MKWIFGTILLLVLGLVLQLNLLIYAMYVLLGVLLLCRFFTRIWTSGIEARRFSSEEVLEIGGTTEVKVAVQNTSRWSIPWLMLEDALPKDALTQAPFRIKAQGARLVLVRLPPGEMRILSYKVQFLQRGYYQLGPLLAETGDVFGLHRRFRVLTEPHYALVMPKVLPLEGYSLSSRRPIGEIRLSHRLFEDPTRLAGIRPYQQGDPLNRIHWRATARAGQLQSRAYESSCVAGATFLLDFHALSFPGSNGAISAELAIVSVASLANAVFLIGQQIGLVTNGRDAADRIRDEGWRAEFLTRKEAFRAAGVKENTRLRPVVVEAAKGEMQFTNVLATLARLEPTDGLDFPAMLRDAAPHIRRDTTAVAVLGSVTPETAAALGALRRMGQPVTVLMVSGGMEPIPEWARPPDWAQMLLEQSIDFRIISHEESIQNLCAEALIR